VFIKQLIDIAFPIANQHKESSRKTFVVASSILIYTTILLTRNEISNPSSIDFSRPLEYIKVSNDKELKFALECFNGR
jgi:hypothetical protein